MNWAIIVIEALVDTVSHRRRDLRMHPLGEYLQNICVYFHRFCTSDIIFFQSCF